MVQSRHTVLIVDDDPAFRSLLAWAVRYDFIAWPAVDGQNGFNKALKLQPDCVLLDLGMPGWSGLHTLKEFRSHPKLRHIPIIVLTADATRETVTAAIEAGATDYLLKTRFVPAELADKLRRIIAAAEAAHRTSAKA